MSRLILGAPVANRAWSIPLWMECVAKQTRKPDTMVFLHGGTVMDDTWRALDDEAWKHRLPYPWIIHDDTPPHRREDNDRFLTLARLRNRVLELARWHDADLFLSLDTDIMLENPNTIEDLCDLVERDDADIVSPLVFLHPLAPRQWKPGERVSYAYNFAFLPEGANSMQRPNPAELPDVWGKLVRHQIPMGCWVGNRKAINCEYSWNESGEDIGFAISLRDAGVECIADTSLYGWHVWSHQHMPGQMMYVETRP